MSDIEVETMISTVKTLKNEFTEEQNQILLAKFLVKEFGLDETKISEFVNGYKIKFEKSLNRCN